jgi:hypothetical protein
MHLPPCPHRGASVGLDRWECSAPQLIVPRGWVESRTCRDLCPLVDRTPHDLPLAEPTAAPLIRPLPGSDQLAIAMIGAPRPRPTIRRTLREMRRAGFTQPIYVFEEPGTRTQRRPGVVIHTNPRRLRMWQNWLQAARFLLEGTDAPYLLLCEDDLELCPAAAATLLAAMPTLARDDFGLASLFTPQHNLETTVRQGGWQAHNRGWGSWGSLAYCFTRGSLSRILRERELVAHAGTESTDGVVCRACLNLGLATYYHVPSLCSHTGGGISTVGHQIHAESQAIDFDRNYRGRELPLVSCIMPTADRPEFAAQAIRCFQRQDYPRRELLVIDDGNASIAHLADQQPGVRYFRLDRRQSCGAKRNIACEAARGEILIQWDDDDWSGPRRIHRQVEPILGGQADVTALTDTLVFDLQAWEAWRWTPGEFQRLFFRGVHCGTLAFRRTVWERLARYPDAWTGSDLGFIRPVVERGGRLLGVPGREDFVYFRHGTNTWRIAGEAARARSAAGIRLPIAADELAAYRRLRERLFALM